MSYATLAPSVDERRFGVVGVFLRSVLGQFNGRHVRDQTDLTSGALSEPELADIGHARGMISGATQQTTEPR